MDNDGDEATVVVEASGVSRRTQQPFKTVFLHAYTVGPMGQILKFKETTDIALMARLIPQPQSMPTTAAADGAAAGATADGNFITAQQLAAGEVAVQPGFTARST